MSEIKTIRQAVKEEETYMRARHAGLIKSMQTPWDGINKAGIDGLEWGTITTIGAMSGAGKTAMINQLLTEVHGLNPDQDIAILFFTMEMAARRLIGRTISHQTGRTVKELYTSVSDQDLDHIFGNVTPKFLKLDINYIETPRTPKQTAQQIISFAKKRPDKFILVMYDHAVLTLRDGGTERDTIIDLMMQFNQLKKIFPNSSYVLLSQLNRDIEKVERKKVSGHFPQKSDFFGSEAMYQFSDIVIALHNPAALRIKSYGSRNWPTYGFLFMHTLKVRDGDPGHVIVCWNKLAKNRIEELTDQEKKHNKFV